MAKPLSRIAQQTFDFLKKFSEENPDRYYAALGTKFIEFVDFVERAFVGLNERLKKVEGSQEEIMRLITEAAGQLQGGAAAGEAPANGTVAAAGAQPAALQQARPAAVSGDTRNMVRVGGDGLALSPEDQKAEEEADLTLHGEIDTTRYVPRGSVGNQQSAQS